MDEWLKFERLNEYPKSGLESTNKKEPASGDESWMPLVFLVLLAIGFWVYKFLK